MFRYKLYIPILVRITGIRDALFDQTRYAVLMGSMSFGCLWGGAFLRQPKVVMGFLGILKVVRAPHCFSDGRKFPPGVAGGFVFFSDLYHAYTLRAHPNSKYWDTRWGVFAKRSTRFLGGRNFSGV